MSTHDLLSPLPVRTGVLLAGGGGRRMGVDKEVLTLGGRSLLARGASFLRALFPQVAVSVAAGAAADLGDASDLIAVPDAFAGRSPLVGIASALRRFQEPVFISAVDLAFPDAHLARVLVDALGDADVCLPQVDGLLEPLFAVYSHTCLEPMRHALERGEHRIVAAFPRLRVRTVVVDDRAPFFNVNRPADFEAARQLERAAPGPGRRPALVAVVGKSDSGKTTLVERLLPELLRLGIRVASVKHDAHSFDIDHPGKDSYRHGAAGAVAYVVSSPSRVAYVGTVEQELSLTEIVERFFSDMDLVVAEGYKRSAPHRVEVFRQAAGHSEPLCGLGESLALVTDARLEHPHRFALEDGAGLAAFVARRLDSLREY
jgi:molybdopterin-guanine dinucleotide biosynthesis protein